MVLWFFALLATVGLLFGIWGNGIFFKIGISIFGVIMVFAFFWLLEMKADE